MQDAVHPAPAAVELTRHRGQMILVVDVELEHVGRLRQARGCPLGHPHPASEPGQQDLGPCELRLARDREGDAAPGDDAGDEQPLAGQQVRRSKGRLRVEPEQAGKARRGLAVAASRRVQAVGDEVLGLGEARMLGHVEAGDVEVARRPPRVARLSSTSPRSSRALVRGPSSRKSQRSGAVAVTTTSELEARRRRANRALSRRR